MASAVREWLPETALSPDRLATALEGILSTWATASFPATRTECIVCGDGQKLISGDPIVVGGSGARVALSEASKPLLLEAALGVSLDVVTLSERDHLVLDSLARCLMERLRDLLDDALAPAPSGAKPVLLQLSLAGKPIGEIRVAQAALVPLIKQRLPTQCAGGKPLLRRIDGVAGLKVRVEGVLGSIALTVEDARHLSIGDVLIVDSKVTDAVSLRIADNAEVCARGHLNPEDGRNELRLIFS